MIQLRHWNKAPMKSSKGPKLGIVKATNITERIQPDRAKARLEENSKNNRLILILLTYLEVH